MRPLDGITVVTLEHAVAAPFCTRQLADLGARVIKVERPGSGDFARAYDQRVHGLASHFVWTNRSKESLTLDLKHAAAPALLARLLAGADVLVQNLAPGAAARLGLSYEDLRATCPRLIVCDLSGYGGDGPYRDRKAYDLLIQSEAGFLSVTGSADAPAKAGCSIADIAAGMYAYSSILAALLQRAQSGCGCRIEVSMLESMVEWMGYPLYYACDGAAPPPRAGAAHATIYPYGPFAAGDGKLLILGVQNEREWQLFCRQVLDRPELADDARYASNASRSAARDELQALIVEQFSRLDSEAADRPPRRGADRQRAHQRHARSLAAPAARGTRAMDRGGDPGRPDSGTAAAGQQQRLHAAHGRGAGPRTAHRCNPRRTRLRRSGDRAPCAPPAPSERSPPPNPSRTACVRSATVAPGAGCRAVWQRGPRATDGDRRTMNHWTPGSFFLALAAVILLPALVIHYTLGRKGGHHLFGDLPREKARDLPFAMLRFNLRNDLRGSLATLAGLGLALAAYPLACRLGLPINFLGLSEKQLFFAPFLGGGLLVLVVLSLLRRRRPD
jgi:itaconate CoA-transferase